MSLVTVESYETLAKKYLPEFAYSFYSTAALSHSSLNRNRQIFSRLLIEQQVLRGVGNVDLSCKVLGKSISAPICASPTAFHHFAHPNAERETAKGVAEFGSLMILSSASSLSLEEVSKASEGPKWMNSYIYKERSYTAELLQRAETSGYAAFVVSVDIPYLGKRTFSPIADDSGYKPLVMKMFESAGNFPPNDTNHIHGDPDAVWDDIKWVMSIAKIPVVLKGILSVSDALKAIEYGVAAIIVSNHGGRQLDCAPSTLEVLPHIVKAVNGRCEVYVDGGVRSGTDVFKLLALGANAVFVGRPILWGLTVKGADGVKDVLSILRDELHNTMALAGCRSVAEITRKSVVLEDFYRSKI